MANKKYTKLGIALTSLAVLGMAQAFPLDIPVIGTQVVMAEEVDNAVRIDVYAFNNDYYFEALVGDYLAFAETESLTPIETKYLREGESITINSPMIDGYEYSSYEILNTSDKSAVAGEHPNVFLSYETLTAAINNANHYHLNLLYVKTSKIPDQDPATDNTVNTPTDGATGEDSTGTVDSGKVDTPPTGDGSNTTELPTQPTDGTGADANTETSTGDNQPDTGQADASSNADTNSDNTVPTDIPNTGESEAGNKQELPTTPTDKPADNGQASKPADTGEKTPSSPADDKKTVDTPTVRPDQPSSTPTTPVVSAITFDRGPRVDASQSSTVTQVAPVMMTGADTKTTLAPTATDTPRQPLSRVDSRHLPKTGDSHSLLAIFFGLTSLTTGLFDLRKSKK